MRHPRVVHIAPSLFGAGGIYGGGERYAWELSRAMAERVPTRLVGFQARRGAAPHHQASGALSVYALRPCLPGRRFASSQLSPGLLRHLLWADVIHCHQTHNLSADLATTLAACFRKPVFGTDHGGGGYSLRRGAGFTGRLWVSRFSQSLVPPQTGDRVILGGVDTSRFHPPSSDGFCGDQLLFVGRLLPHKGIDVLIRAAARAAVPLSVVGRPASDGAYLLHLRQLADSLAARVTFVTDCDDAELVVYYQRALCLALPSVYRSDYGSHPVAELLGQTLLEAMACATPVLASAVGGMPEIVVDGATGFLLPPNDPDSFADKIAWYRDHPKETRCMGAAARAHVLVHFTWDAVVDRCLAAYVGSAGGPA